MAMNGLKQTIWEYWTAHEVEVKSHVLSCSCDCCSHFEVKGRTAGLAASWMKTKT